MGRGNYNSARSKRQIARAGLLWPGDLAIAAVGVGAWAGSFVRPGPLCRAARHPGQATIWAPARPDKTLSWRQLCVRPTGCECGPDEWAPGARNLAAGARGAPNGARQHVAHPSSALARRRTHARVIGRRRAPPIQGPAGPLFALPAGGSNWLRSRRAP